MIFVHFILFLYGLAPRTRKMWTSQERSVRGYSVPSSAHHEPQLIASSLPKHIPLRSGLAVSPTEVFENTTDPLKLSLAWK